MQHTTLHFESARHLACSLNVPVGRVIRVAEELGVHPVTVNGHVSFDEIGAERIAADIVAKREATN